MIASTRLFFVTFWLEIMGANDFLEKNTDIKTLNTDRFAVNWIVQGRYLLWTNQRIPCLCYYVAVRSKLTTKV